MRQLKDAKLTPIALSTIEMCKEYGYEPIGGCDAAKANSDYFMIMIRRPKPGEKAETPTKIEIICPSFLRNPITVSIQGAISY